MFAEGQPGALETTLTAEQSLSTLVEVRCGQPDPNWVELEEAWAIEGALQLWVLDPLSGFLKQMLDEIPLSCFDVSTFADIANPELGDGGQASNAILKDPYDIELLPNGSYYIADTLNGRVRKVYANGMITSVANGITAYGIGAGLDGSVYRGL